ncbi:MFS transporter [Pseudomonas rhodesiae]|uniref:MFS transporter n=1 Tax=Pseudomonas rhodesiae TaxID=76760 RepID=UPI001BCCFD74|nr:MFS transporter [Pseudomonas rhodesiae]QVN04035.1 MFS transporter [Pseudomonas rhodesiae]
MSATTITNSQLEVVKERLTAYHVWVMVLGVLGYASVAADSALLPTAFPLLSKDLGLDLSILGYIYAAGFISCGIIGMTVAGRATDKWGRKPVMVSALSMTAVFTMLSSLAWNVESFTVARTIATVGYVTWATAGVLIAESVPSQHRGWMIGCIPAGWGLGFGLSALFSGEVATSIGWRPTFLLIGALPLVLALLVAFTIKETPRFLAIKRMNSSELAALRQAKPSIKILFSSGLRRRTIGVSLFFFFAVWMNQLTSYYSIPYLATRGIDFVTANNAIAIGSWIGVIATVITGLFTVMRGSHWTLITLSIISGLSAIGLLVSETDTLIPIFIICMVLALALWGAAPNLTQEAFPTWVRGTGSAFASGCGWAGYGISSLLIQPMVSAFSWSTIWIIVAIPITLILVASIFITPRPQGRNADLPDF